MTKRKKPGASSSKPKAKTDTPVKDKTTSRVISKPALLALMKSIKVYASDMDSARADIGSAVAAAVKTKYLHKKAFAIFRSLDKLPELKREETLRQIMMMGAHMGWDDQKTIFGKVQYVDPKKQEQLFRESSEQAAKPTEAKPVTNGKTATAKGAKPDADAAKDKPGETGTPPTPPATVKDDTGKGTEAVH